MEEIVITEINNLMLHCALQKSLLSGGDWSVQVT